MSFYQPIHRKPCTYQITHPPPPKVKWLSPYDFFSANFGQVAQATDESLIKKYEDKSKHDLKKSLSPKTLR